MCQKTINELKKIIASRNNDYFFSSLQTRPETGSFNALCNATNDRERERDLKTDSNDTTDWSMMNSRLIVVSTGIWYF